MVRLTKILIVEDHLLTRLGLKMVLDQDPNLEVIGEAEDGVDCLNKIEQLNPDVVLLDIGLPLIDGIECAYRLNKKQSKSRIIFRSSHEELSVIFPAFATGADGFCSKNNPDSILIKAINTVAAGYPWLDPQIAVKILAHCNKLQKTTPIFTAADLDLLENIANNSESNPSVDLRKLMQKVCNLSTYY
ncbi:MAG: response regulator transcription factor [Candidatus Melainabacteria bacterium]|nr:response regulator transcription factor [Candidatus Melainabacteria bacterium]